jgi:hypothetical protein
MYLNDGRRFSLGQFPEQEPAFFDEAVSIYEFPRQDAFASGKVPALNPCTGCPGQDADAAP